MNTSTVLLLCSSVVFSMASSGNAVVEWSNMRNSIVQDGAAVINKSDETANPFDQGAGAMQQALIVAQATSTEGLTGVLMQRLNVSRVQAEGGAGALFQIAKSRMKAESFNQLSQVVPGMQNLLSMAPAIDPTPGGLDGGLSSMAGVSSNTLTGLNSLAGPFQQLGMSGDMVQRFVPVLVDYVRGSSGDPLANALILALTGS